MSIFRDSGTTTNQCPGQGPVSSEVGETKRCVWCASVACLGCVLLVIAAMLPCVVPEAALRIRWEVLRQLGLVLPGTLFLAFSVARLLPELDPMSALLRINRRWMILLCMAVVTLGAVWSSRHLMRGGPFVPGDEDEYLFQARVLAHGRLWWDVPVDVEFFITPGQLVAGDRLFGHHQWGHPLLLALGVLAGEPRAVPICLACLAVPLCYGLGRALGGENAAKLSSLLLAVSPFFVFTMGSLVSETSSMFLLLVALYLLVVRKVSGGCSVLAGAILGLAAATRALSTVAISVPLLAWWMRNRRTRDVVLLASGALPLLIAIGATNAVLTGSPWTLPFSLYEVDALGFRSSYGLVDGLRNLGSNLTLLNFWLMGWPLSLAIVGMCFWKLRGSSAGMVLAIACTGLGAAYVLYWHNGQVATGPLRLFEACPALLCVAGAGLAKWRQRGAREAATVGWVVVVSICMSLITFVPGRAGVVRRFTEGVAAPAALVERAGLSRSIVFLRAENYLFSYPRNDLGFEHRRDVVFARDRGARNEELLKRYPGYFAYLLVRDEQGEWHLEHLPREQRPAEATPTPESGGAAPALSQKCVEAPSGPRVVLPGSA